jgi:hypothetical protein
MADYWINTQVLHHFGLGEATLGTTFLCPLDGHLVRIDRWDMYRDRYVGTVMAWAA